MFIMKRQFGGGTTARDRAIPEPQNQAVTESVATTTRRKFKGPQVNGHFSVHAIVDSVTAPTSTTGLTVWYSNLPDPSTASDADWVQDSTVGTLKTLTATGSAFANVGNVFAEWIMLKADITAGSVTMRAFTRVEGPDGR